MTRLEALSAQIPAQVRPVYQIWHDGQALQLALSAERQRYSKLQQMSDSELDALRQQQQALQTQLDLTTRKLESLTDIERQLSTRNRQGITTPIRRIRMTNPRRLKMARRRRRHKMR